MSFVKDTFNALTGRGAQKASEQAASTQAQAQQNALNYIRETEELPQQFRQGAISQLGGLAGLEGGDPDADQNIRANPLFQATLGNIPQQEEAILRNQSATGALRTGGTEMMLADNQRTNTLDAYQNAMGGLQGLASIPSNTNQIAGGMAGIGKTLAQGQVAGANARQQALGGLLQTGGKAAAAFSDIRLKDNINHVGERYGHSWFTWDWNDTAGGMGLSGSSEGVIADLVKPMHPDLIGERDGYLTVDYTAMESA